MRLTMRSVSGAVLAVCLSTAGCASTIQGQATAADNGGGPTTTSSSPEPSDPTTTSATESSAEPTDSGRTELSCTGTVVQPDGAPYCYTSPAGLDPIDLQGVDAGQEGVYRSSFGTASKDYVDVQVYELSSNIDDVSTEDIISELATVVTSLEAGGFAFDDSPTMATVDAARDFFYNGTSSDGSQVIVSHFIFRGMTEVQVNCSSTTDAVAIDPACASVLGSMQLIG